MNRSANILVHKNKFFSALFLILVFLTGFLVTAILNNRISKQKQIIKSDAALLSPIQEAACINKSGECQTGKRNDVGKPCVLTDGDPGVVEFNLCPTQEDDVRCCVRTGNVQPTSAPAQTAGLTVEFQGIGPNSTPLNSVRSVTSKIFKVEGSFESADYVANDTLTYESATGKFVNNNFNFGSIPAGKYQMVIQEEKYLDEQLVDKVGKKIIELSSAAKLELAPVKMRAGDLSPGDKGDNFVNIIDYNALIGCMPAAPIGSCLNRNYADLNDDGKVDQVDLDILMSNFGDIGFAFQTARFKCEPDPACGASKNSLQMCSLLCTKVSKRS